MAFGKRNSEPIRLKEPFDQPVDSERASVLVKLISMLTVLLGFAFVLAAAAWLQSYFFVRSIDNFWEDFSKRPFLETIATLQEQLDPKTDAVELAVHTKCRSRADSGLSYGQARIAKETGKGVDAFTGPTAVKYAADYVACTIADTPARFCEAPARKRLVRLIVGYLELQKKEAQIQELDMRFNGLEDSELLAPMGGIDIEKLSILKHTDKRILNSLRDLASKGIVTQDDFVEGFLGTSPKQLTPALAGISPQTGSCKLG